MSVELIGIVAVGAALAGVILTATRGLRQDVGRLEARLDKRINGLESQISELRERMSHEIGELRAEVAQLRERMAHLEGLLEGLREAISGRVKAS